MTRTTPLATLLAFLLLCLATTGCSKLEVDSEADATGATGGETATNIPTDTLSVAEALALEGGEDIVVCGYIVGYISSTSISSFMPGVPTDKNNTNLVLADDPDTQEYDQILPVKLEAGSSFRTDWNLRLRPELLGRRVYVFAELLSPYFGRTGITRIVDIRLADTEDESEETPNEPGLDSGGERVDEGR